MLTDIAVRKLEAKERRYMVRDEKGLYIEVLPSGRKYWRIRCWSNGKETKRSLGAYPDISLKEARFRRDEIRLELANGGNPFKSQGATENTFKTVSQEWFETRVLPIRTPGHSRTIRSRLDRLILPYIGHRTLRDLTAADLLAVARRIEKQRHYETAHRVVQICGQIFRYGVATGRADRDPSGDIRGALIPKKNRHYPTITDPVKIGALLRAIDSLDSIIVKNALKVQALTFVRPGELRTAEWNEIDMDKEEWKIPPEKMKMRKPHIVPLAKQTLDVLKEIFPLISPCKWVFPAVRTMDRPMSDATVNAALRRLGYAQDEFTGHGFRSMASTILNEQGWPVDAIERQLAHAERDTVRAAYNHAEYLPERRKMMQWWADWLDSLV